MSEADTQLILLTETFTNFRKKEVQSTDNICRNNLVQTKQKVQSTAIYSKWQIPTPLNA